MCKKNMFHGVNCVGSVLPSDLGFQLPGNRKAKPVLDAKKPDDLSRMPVDLATLLDLLMNDFERVETAKDKSFETPEVKAFGEPIKLKNGKWGLKISRADAFVLLKPIKVLNSDGDEFRLYGFIRNSRKTRPFWFMNNGKWFNDDYFYIETEAPCTKMTLDEVEEKLGLKVEIIE